MADTPIHAANDDELLSDADFGAVKAPAIEGEGSYDATREYNERTKRFIDQQGSHIAELAHHAAAALDGPEAEELHDAENEGLTKVRH